MTLRNIIEELDSIIPEKNKHLIIEQRANNLITAIINLKEDIRSKFSEEEADELVRRIDNSVRGEDPKKFQRKIREIKERAEPKRGFLD